MTFLEFLETYYIWLLVVTVILIITIIGYLADRRDKKRKLVKEQVESNAVVSNNVNLTGTVPVQESLNNISAQQPVVNDKVSDNMVTDAPVVPNVNQNIGSPIVNEVPEVNPQMNIMNNIKEPMMGVNNVEAVQQSKVNNNLGVISEPTAIVTPVMESPQVDSAFKTHDEIEIPLETPKIDETIKIVPIEEPQIVIPPVEVSGNSSTTNTDVSARQHQGNGSMVEPTMSMTIPNEDIVVPPVEGFGSNSVLGASPVIEPVIHEPVQKVQPMPGVTNVSEPSNVNQNGGNIVMPPETPIVNDTNQSNGIVNPIEVNTNTADKFEDDIWKL